MTTATAGKLAVGDQAPTFSLPNQTGQLVDLQSLLGHKKIVLFFYPKDHSAGCVAEVCAFRDQYEVFKQAGAEVIGISSDSVESHEKFAANNRLPFTLLSDRDGTVRKLYGATTLGILAGRVTYIIDHHGTIQHIFSSLLNANKHISEALRIIKEA
ncbi:MAG TPA: peroxiredoxin [Herpetosiphon sp.]|uniref:thioredoxin-dependent peroxiredoxin n=1 Tax=Herpetosiphon aurantiacus (strain ATCC 23779 / DSM 785 / 114-95) TaxID=316274 RepID=A9B1G6_HERA2|nr:peroxiredoxin [Herpetosiphon sp.]ABX07353.1 alkyl hydroperoxide reductase/ Thiol specific antioxidant/ Mal allergen [Herpetosiphon aurantiacus DSM 785]HBW51189.1 peroxiredoxin [Herpetosiphon sp.]